MNSKRLREVRQAYKEREDLKNKIIELEYMRISPRAAVYGTERVQTSMKGDVQPETLAALDGLMEAYNEKLRACCELIAEFEEAVNGLSGRERRAVRYYFLDHMAWEQIAPHMQISTATLNRIKKNALKKLKGQ